jgi:phage terminase small subunit
MAGRGGRKPNTVDRPLTHRQARFALEYVVDGNATAAAIRSGYAKGASARVQGCQNLALPNIRAAIDAEMQKVAE